MLQNNPNLNIKVIKFERSPLSQCDFDNINVTCYQENSCKEITGENKIFRRCTKEEIQEVEKTFPRNSHRWLYIGIAFISISILFVIAIIFIVFKKRPKNKVNDCNRSSTSSGKSSISISTIFRNVLQLESLSKN